MFLGLPWAFWGTLCILVATLYAAVWPRPRPGTTRVGWHHLVLRWGHTVVWVLLALACFTRAFAPALESLADSFASLAFFSYALFLTVFFLDRRQV